jgi:carboxymethylenebutenolidase
MEHLTRPEGTEPEDLHLSRRGAVAGLFFSGYAVAALAQDAKPITTPATGLTIEEALIPNGAAKPLPAYVARPAKGSAHAAIIVVNEIFGIHDYIKDICRRWAQLGYVAIAPDFFYRAGVNLPAISDRAEIMKVVQQATPDQVDGDVRASLDWLKAQWFVNKAKLGITGYCWGGAVVWRSAMLDADIKAGVAFYGQLKPLIARAGELKAPVLGLYGGKDQGIPLTDVEAMKAALKAAGKTGSEIIVYPDAGHGFHADYRSSYDPAAATDAWKRAQAHFRKYGVA